MPPKKKPQKSKPKEPDEPLEYINYIREKSVQRFASKKKNINCDIEQNTREIRALLKINAEIFDRCNSSATIENEGKTASFSRYGFDIVKVRQNEGSGQTQFITEREHSLKSFNIEPLSKLPAGIADVIIIQYQAAPFNTLIDYNAFFKSALMLHDDIHEQFLVKLKTHIESIQVCLGGVESWLLEPKSNIDFIEATFGKKLEIPVAGNTNQDCTCPNGIHCHSDLCLHCGSNYGSHYSNCYYGEERPQMRCPRGGVFRCKKVHILKSCNESGKFEKTFLIGKLSDQTKLKKFLDFMAWARRTSKSGSFSRECLG